MLEELGLTHLGDAGIGVAVLITVIVMGWFVQRVALAWINMTREEKQRADAREKTRQRDQHDQEMAESAANQAVADALRELTKRLDQDRTRADLVEATTRNLITSAKQLTELIETATARMGDRSKVVDQKLDLMHTDIKSVPTEVWRKVPSEWRLGDLVTTLGQMETRLLDRISPNADVARAVIREEVGDLVSRIMTLVDALERDQRAGDDANVKNGDQPDGNQAVVNGTGVTAASTPNKGENTQ